MTVLLPRELQQFVEQEVASGTYGSDVDVICAGLRLLRERESRIQSLRSEILPAIEQLNRGEGRPLDGESIKARGRERLAARNEK